MGGKPRVAHISIHALHEESDSKSSIQRFHAGISIHALHEESDKHAHDGTADATKISIHALHEESDQVKADFGLIIGISIHALHEESDHIPYCLCGMGNHFNPRSP